MLVCVSLVDIETGVKDEVSFDTDNNKVLHYFDNNNNKCSINIYNDGLLVEKDANDYRLHLNLRSDSFASITTSEGEIKLNTKVVDFICNDDILLMRYSIEEQLKEIRIYFRS